MTTPRIGNADMNIQEIIINFLAECGDPTPNDWKQLIDKHPYFADGIVDAALLHRGSQHLVEADVEATLDKEAYEATVSEAVNLLHTMPSAQRATVEEKIAAVSGPSARQLAAEVGLGSFVPLFNSVLEGTVEAPAKVLFRLGTLWQTSVAMLMELFRLSFENRAVPAFKAESGKPEVSDRPISWESAVRSLKLSQEQTKELLSLDH